MSFNSTMFSPYVIFAYPIHSTLFSTIFSTLVLSNTLLTFMSGSVISGTIMQSVLLVNVLYLTVTLDLEERTATSPCWSNTLLSMLTVYLLLDS